MTRNDGGEEEGKGVPPSSTGREGRTLLLGKALTMQFERRHQAPGAYEARPSGKQRVGDRRRGTRSRRRGAKRKELPWHYLCHLCDPSFAGNFSLFSRYRFLSLSFGSSLLSRILVCCAERFLLLDSRPSFASLAAPSCWPVVCPAAKVGIIRDLSLKI